MKFNRQQMLGQLQPFLAMSKEGKLSEHYTGMQISDDTWQAVNQFGWFSLCPGSVDLEVRFEVEPLVRLLSSSSADEIDLREHKGKLVFDSPGHSAKLPLYPQSDWHEPEREYNVSTTSPVPAILQAMGCSDESPNRATCHGVQVRDGWAMTTDGLRLAAYRTAFEEHLRVPLPAAKMLAHLGPEAEFSWSQTHIRAQDECTTYVAGLHDSPCLNWELLLKEREHSICLNRSEVLGALKRSAILGEGYVDLEANGGEMILTVPDKSRVVIECQGELEIPIRLNPQFLKEALTTLKEPKFVLEYTDERSPLVIQEGDLLHMIMSIARLGR